MIYDMVVQADAASVKITIPQKALSWEITNVAAYTISKGLIVTIGETEETMTTRLLEEGKSETWQKWKHDIGFVAPFAIDTFHPRFIQDILAFYRIEARRALRPGLPPLFGKFNCDIWISDYEKLPFATRQEFAYHLHEDFSNRVSVNGETFNGWPYRIAAWAFRSFELVPILLGLVLLRLFAMLSKTGNDIFTLVGILTIAVMTIIGAFGGSVLGVSVLRNFLPPHTLSVLLPNSGLPKRILRWLNGMLEDSD